PKKDGPGTENPLYDLALARGVRIVPEAGTDSFLMLNGVPASEEDTLTVVGNLIEMDMAMKAVGEAAAAGGPDMSGAEACEPLQGNPLIKLATSILVNQRDFMDKTSCLDY